jgi:Anti-sigma-K factor rskA, C-terminal
MTTRIKLLNLVLFSSLLFSACKDDDADDVDTSMDTSTLNLSFTGLEDLGNDATYEGWIIVDGNAVSTGTFDVNSNGQMSRNAFEINPSDLMGASTFILTIEPKPDTDPTPSKVHIVAGDFSGSSASLTIDHGAALNNTFSTASGKYILATPTDDDTTNDESGIWFLDISSGTPAVGLNLPMLPDGWIYEGWAVINGTPVSTGTFTALDMADNSATFSGSKSGPPFPGEDFLMNAPGMLSFPTDLKGGKAVISIEPVPDNSASPFTLKPLVGDIPTMATNRTNYDLGQNLSFPTGQATR